LNDSTNEVYELQLLSTSDGHVFYPEWQGVSTAAQLVTSVSQDPNYSSYGDPSTQALQSAGTSVGTGPLAAAVPEPASIALLGMGVFGIAALRRKAI
jgi:hypothetical protein